MLNYNKHETRQKNWDKTYFYINRRRGFCIDLATENPQRGIKPYECLNEVKALMDFILHVITMEQTCPIMNCKDKAEKDLHTVGGTMDWKGLKFRSAVQGISFHRSFCFFPGNLSYLVLHLREGPNDILISMQRSLMSLRFLPLLESDGIKDPWLIFMNFEKDKAALQKLIY